MKIWAISDPHQKHEELKVPDDIDMVICAGDIGNNRSAALNHKEVVLFLEWFSLLPIKHKVLVAGNHDTSIEAGLVDMKDYPYITYLKHSSAIIEGINIFGSPYTPSFGTGWAFNVRRDKLHKYWKEIPICTDILVTHGPPKGVLDLTASTISREDFVKEPHDNKAYFQCGDKSLFKKVLEIQPKYHIFGHIHTEDNVPNAAKLQIQNCKTIFINASVVNLGYKKVNDGYIINYFNSLY